MMLRIGQTAVTVPVMKTGNCQPKDYLLLACAGRCRICTLRKCGYPGAVGPCAVRKHRLGSDTK